MKKVLVISNRFPQFFFYFMGIPSYSLLPPFSLYHPTGDMKEN